MTMKRNVIISLILAAVTVSCGKAEQPVASSAVPLSVDVSSGDVMAARSPISGTALPVSRSIVMAAYYNAPGGGGSNYFSGRIFSYHSGTTWQLSSAYWPLAGSLDMLGYSLADASHVSSVIWGGNNAASVTMTLADNSGNQDDLVVGGASALTSASKAITFRHAETMLAFTAYTDVAYNASSNTGVTVTGLTVNGAYHSGTVSCTRSGSAVSFFWSSLGSSAAALSLPSLSSTDLGVSAAALAGTPGLILPAQSAVAFTVYYTLHCGRDGLGGAIDKSMSYTHTPAGSWSAGTKYTYCLYITNSGVTVNLADAFAWTDGIEIGDDFVWE